MVTETARQQGKRVITAKWDEIEAAEDVFIDILSRLSVRDIRSLKTVRKKWHKSMRTTKHFAKQHITYSRKRLSYITCPRMGKPMELFSLTPGNFKLINLNMIDPPQRGDNEDLYMISSFNGLICCINEVCENDVRSKFCDLQIWICNPSTGETFLLPQGTPSFMFEPSVGVAYASNTSDYQVYRIFSVRDHVYECEVYMSSTRAWKNIGPVPRLPMHAHLSPYKSSHVFVRQKIYWLVSLDESGEILCMDLEGTFEVIKLPEYSDDGKEEDKITEGTYLINLQGSLAVVVQHPEDMDIWVWKEDDRNEFSWKFKCGVQTQFNQYDVVRAITSLENEIIFMTETRCCSYDVYAKTWKRGKKNNDGFVHPAVFPFTESILPCNGGVQL